MGASYGRGPLHLAAAAVDLPDRFGAVRRAGVFRTEYQGATLRSHLGPAHPAREG
ncbi:hypothetical protein [Streptomyces sp. NPDC007856]|uniref:hypothetical protein n=1 Tax=Streptomyces sp. NPDC007856 TaxID=3364781 RepID=UPI0036D19DBE